jgi:hypothetical protein
MTCAGDSRRQRIKHDSLADPTWSTEFRQTERVWRVDSVWRRRTMRNLQEEAGGTVELDLLQAASRMKASYRPEEGTQKRARIRERATPSANRWSSTPMACPNLAYGARRDFLRIYRQAWGPFCLAQRRRWLCPVSDGRLPSYVGIGITARELLSFSRPCLMLMNKLSLRGECGEHASTHLAQTWTLHPDGRRAPRRRP